MNMRPLPEELIKHPWITGKFNIKKLYKMKTDKEISFVKKKTNFENFWKLIEVDKPKNTSITVNNSINLKKKKKLEIVGLSYCDPSKINSMQKEKKINNNNNIKELLGSKKKYKKILTHFDKKIKGKENEIKSRQEKAKDLNFYPKNNKTEITINKDIRDDNEDKAIGVPELRPRMRKKQNSKLKSINQMTFSNLNKYENNNNNNSNINKNISSCRHSNTNTNGSICYIKN